MFSILDVYIWGSVVSMVSVPFWSLGREGVPGSSVESCWGAIEGLIRGSHMWEELSLVGLQGHRVSSDPW